MRRRPPRPVAIAITIVVMLAAAPSLGRAADNYRWMTYAPGQTVQYGVADTDKRTLRIDCLRGRRERWLEIAGPAYVQAKSGAPVNVTLTGRSGPKTARGRIAMLGDGANFTVRVRAQADSLQTLVHGRPLTVSSGGKTWTVPGEGAAAVLGPLIKSCAAHRRR